MPASRIAPQHIVQLTRGFTLVELMVAMAIGLMVVATVMALYVNTQQSQRTLDRQSQSSEAGAYALELLGREIANAGYYPAQFTSIPAEPSQAGMYDSYPPLEYAVENPVNRRPTDWQNSHSAWPPSAYWSGVFGCTGGEFNVSTATCPTPDTTKADSIVINYFTGDATGTASARNDCTGSSVENDSSNKARTNASKNKNTPPLQPLFVSNRYTLKSTKQRIDGVDVTTWSLACSGNGNNPHGTVSLYQPIVAGLVDLRFTFGVHGGVGELLPVRFYTASEVSAMSPVTLMGEAFSGWQRVVAVRVCLLTETLGGGARLADSAGKEKTYRDCTDVELKQPSGKLIQRFVQVFGVRNGLTQSY